MVAFLGSITALLLMLSAKDLIFLLLGPEWSEAGMVVMAFSPGIAAALVYGTHPWLHLSLGTPNRWLRWNLFASLFTIAAFITAAPFGAVAMAIAYSATSYVLLIPALWYAGRPIQLSLRKVTNCIWTYFASAFSVFFLWFYLSAHWLPLKALVVGLSPLNRILTTSIISFFLFIAIAIILQRNFSSIREMISLLRIILLRKGH
jgi:O-antigen/teichoic acid export membrane protein